MAAAGKPAPSEASAAEAAAGDSLSALRRLLLSPEQRRIEELGERLDDPQLRALDVSRVLPEALRLSAKKDAGAGAGVDAKKGESLSDALSPTVEAIIHDSVRRDSRQFADALFPVIGPAIRKAMAETLRQMLQSLSEILDHSFSRQGLAWRFEAWRSGRPFAEVVLLHSLVFRVEQVFLIHRESGILLQHLSAGNAAFADADLVSAMLTAIQDFVRDSFAVAGDQAIDSIQMGDFTIWVEQGPEAVIAGAIRGNAPEELRGVFRETLESIHQEQAEALRTFNGDPGVFETDAVLQPLERCLQARYRERHRRISPLLIVLLLALLAAGGYWALAGLREQRAFDDYLRRLADVPGIVVTAAGEAGDGYRVQGLRDPLAVDPATLLGEGPLDAQRVQLRFEPYQALSPSFVLARARRVLQPPATVDLAMDGEVLRLRGSAPAGWIAEARRLARVLPGVAAVDASGLQDQTRGELQALQTALAAQVIRFGVDTARGAADAQTLQQLARDLRRLQALGQGPMPRVVLVGHSDATGTAARNLVLSRRRADWLRRQLVALGVDPALLSVRATGSNEPVSAEDTPEGRALNRSVTLELAPAEPRGAGR